MSEPPEQEAEEEPDDPAAAADLEELLEQFREPEEPRLKSANPLWLISAFLLSVLACWLALRASGGGAGDKPESAAMAGAMLPGKTSERLPRDEEPVDVVEDYLARCKKGMTAQEVRWIVEDFQRAGLGEGPGSLAFEFNQIKESTSDFEVLERFAVRMGNCQRIWYADAVQAALRLNALQVDGLEQSLEKALESERGVCREIRAEYMKNREARVEPKSAAIYFSFLSRPGTWLGSKSYRPGELVTLTEAQARISWFANWNGDSPENGVDPFPSSPNAKMIDLSSIRLRNYEPNASPISVSFVTREELKLTAGNLFLAAFTTDQKYRNGSVIELAKVLHPAQLRMLLLLAPAAAGEILSELEQGNE